MKNEIRNNWEEKDENKKNPQTPTKFPSGDWNMESRIFRQNRALEIDEYRIYEKKKRNERNYMVDAKLLGTREFNCV